MTRNRPWSAEAQYPGKATFLVGTVVIEDGTPSHEINRQLKDHALSFLPDGFAIVRPVCGAIFFAPDGDPR